MAGCKFVQQDFELPTLAGCPHDSPLAAAYKDHKFFVTDNDRILLDCSVSGSVMTSEWQCLTSHPPPHAQLGGDGGCVSASPLPHDETHSISLCRAGPRTKLHFLPETTRAAIVTCGGLCPGLNNVIRSVTRELLLNYKIKQVFGVRFGYQGMNPAVGLPPTDLTRDVVENINEFGGTMLGSSRGPQEIGTMLDYLQSLVRE
jgi:hypothetical protein